MRVRFGSIIYFILQPPFCSFPVQRFDIHRWTWSFLNSFESKCHSDNCRRLGAFLVLYSFLLALIGLSFSFCSLINTTQTPYFPPTSSFFIMLESNPPLLQHYGALLCRQAEFPALVCDEPQNGVVMEECQLPLIDLNGLNCHNRNERLACSTAICKASSEWGFFQVVNHGVSLELLQAMSREQVKLFQAPFQRKATCGLLNNSYRWGTASATCPKQLSWSEAFHIPLTKISEEACYGEYSSLRELTKEFAAAMSKLARLLAGILAENLGGQKKAIEDICDESTCFLRLNRYPICPISPEIFGLVPHTDSDFLTILYQDQVGGLQLMKDSQWVAVEPSKDALVVNIGDLFQAWSNNEYKSVEHKVMVNTKTERYSIAYFLCPSYDSLIGSCREPSIYRRFTFREYRSQIQEDVKKRGHKVGLTRFLL